MVPLQNNKKVVSIPASTASNATHSVIIDSLGYDYVSVDVSIGSASATTAPLTLKLGESDVTESFVDIPAFTGGSQLSSTVGFIIAAKSAASAADCVTFNVDTRARKRYLQLSLTPGTTAVCSAVANLARASQAPITASAQGALQVING